MHSDRSQRISSLIEFLVWGGRLSSLPIDEIRLAHCVCVMKGRIALLRMEYNTSVSAIYLDSDMRYSDSHSLLPISWDDSDNNWSKARRAFDLRHYDTFGYSTPDKDVEIVNVRLASVGTVDKPKLKFNPGHGDRLHIESRRVWFSEWAECPVLRRDAMGSGHTFCGPAIVEEAGGTSVIPPTWSVQVPENGALHVRGSRWFH